MLNAFKHFCRWNYSIRDFYVPTGRHKSAKWLFYTNSGPTGHCKCVAGLKTCVKIFSISDDVCHVRRVGIWTRRSSFSCCIALNLAKTAYLNSL